MEHWLEQPMHKSHLITMMDDYDTATTKNGWQVSHNLDHIISLTVFTHVCPSAHNWKQDSSENNFQFSTWHISSWPLSRHSSSKWCGVKTLERTHILGKIPTSLSRLQTQSGQKFCTGQGFVSLWLLLLWCDFTDDTARWMYWSWAVVVTQWWPDLVVPCS